MIQADDFSQVFNRLRTGLQEIAHGMLGSNSEAEDVVHGALRFSVARNAHLGLLRDVAAASERWRLYFAIRRCSGNLLHTRLAPGNGERAPLQLIDGAWNPPGRSRRTALTSCISTRSAIPKSWPDWPRP